MEVSFPLISISTYDTSFSFQCLFLGLCFVILAKYYMTSKNNKSQNETKPLSIFTFLYYATQTFLDMAKIPISEVFMRIGTFVHIKYYSSPMFVISNDFDLIKHIMTSDAWTDRPKNALLIVRANGVQDRGILTSSGDVWKETRRYTVKVLTQLGLGKRSNLVYTTNEELKVFYENLNKLIEETDNKVPVRNLFSLPTINVVWRIIGGTTFSAADPDFQKIVKASDDFVEVNFFQIIIADFLRHIVLNATTIFCLSKMYRAQETLKSHFSSVIHRRQSVVDENKFQDDDDNFTDNFLRQTHINRNKSENKMGHIFNTENLLTTLFDLFEAGVDTTSSTLEIALMHLSMHADVQEKMRLEIKTIVGDREPSFYSDRINMPFTQAVIFEIHRLSSIVPLNFRTSVRDSFLNDTFIKKGSAVVINLYSIHYDEKYWGDPYNFRPQRFLNEDGILEQSKLNRLLNFGAGKRVCIGEIVASISLFTFLVGILQKYKIEHAIPGEHLGMDTHSCFTSRAKPFHVRFELLVK